MNALAPSESRIFTPRFTFVCAAITLIGAFVIAFRFSGAPNYTDAYYHFNAAERLVQGEGFSEPYLWTYIGALEFAGQTIYPSHLYWMPGTSALAALGMTFAPTDRVARLLAAKVPMALLFAGAAGWGFWLGARLGGTRRHALLSGLLTLFSPFFARYWGMTDTFAPYAFFGAGCLALMGGALTAARRAWLWWALAGAYAGFAHLTRPDGLLFVIVGVAAVVFAGFGSRRWRESALRFLPFIAAYILVMLPWFARNLAELGTPLPLGGAASIWFTQYDDLFRYPPGGSAAEFFTVGGIGLLFQTRWVAFAGEGGLLSGNLGTFVAVEGTIIMTPLMLIGLWRRRRQHFLWPFILYVLGIHAAMTLLFPFPGYRGGLFHSAAALVPGWAALGVVGLDDAVTWSARRRRGWRPEMARRVFSTALVVFALALTLIIGGRGSVTLDNPPPALYVALQQALPRSSRLLINDPAQLYYYTGWGGAALPNAVSDALPEIAARYRIGYLVLEDGGIPAPLQAVIASPPDFLTPIPLPIEGVHLYAIASSSVAS